MNRKLVEGVLPSIGVSVTAKHIAKAIPKNAHHCMIADAVLDAVPDAKYIHVDTQTIRYTDTKKKQRRVYLTPKPVQRAIIAFDQGQTAKLKPFEFRMGEGYIAAMGWRANHPNTTAKHGSGRKRTARRGKKRGNPYATRAERQFGLCMFS